MTYLTPVFVLSMISLFLGVLLVLADKFFADYGECKLVVADEDEFIVRGGETLLSYLIAHGINVPSSCAGKASCGYCKVRVLNGGGQLLPTERGFMTRAEKKNGTRLACQVKVKNDMEIFLPDFIETVKNIVKNGLFNPKMRWRFSIAKQQYDLENKKKQKKTDVDRIEKIHDIIEEHRNMPGALIPVLQNINNTFKYLPGHALRYVSAEMDIPLSEVFRISTFYNAFSLKPRGENIVKVCMGTSCYVKGGNKILENIEQELDIKVGESTPDLKFTLETVNCIGCCGQSPVISVNDDIFGYLDKKKTLNIISQYTSDEVRDEKIKT